MLTVTDKDNNASVTLPKDSFVLINLATNPSTGFFWQDAETTAGVLVAVNQDAVDPVPGKPTYVGFKFKILNSGVIQLFYARPWAETQPPAKWFELNVVVT